MPRSKIILVTLAVLLTAACCPKVLPVQHDTTQVIHERVVYAHDTVEVEIPRIVEKIVTADTVSLLENPYAKSVAEVSDGLLHHSLETIPQVIEKPVEIPVYIRDTTTVYKTVEGIPVEKPLTRWQSFRMTVGEITLLVLVILLSTTLLRKFLFKA